MIGLHTIKSDKSLIAIYIGNLLAEIPCTLFLSYIYIVYPACLINVLYELAIFFEIIVTCI